MQMNSPIRCFEGEAKPHEAFWNFKNVDSEQPELELYGYISEYSWFDDDVTPKMFKADLDRIGNGKPIKIRINSYGGDLIAASQMHTMIRDYPGEVTVQIDGVAASAATIVAVAGDKVVIQNHGYFMVHDPSFVFFMAQLNLETMTRMADSLSAAKEGILNSYERKTGLSRARLSKLMTDETWMDARKAVDLGFVDAILEDVEKNLNIPQNAAMVNGLKNFMNVPSAILQALQNVETPEVIDSSDPLLSEEDEREAQTLRERIELILRKENENA